MYRLFLTFLVMLNLLPLVAGETEDVFLNENGKASELRLAMLSATSADEASAPFSGITKSPKKGLLFSALVPGAGQFYSGSWVKGLAFLGVEVGCWVGYKQYHDEGESIEDEFHLYADTHWSEERWRANLQPSDPSTHNLPPTKTQQYYEMIGKYDQFKRGWDDYTENGPDLTPHRDEYETMRDESNQNFIMASRLSMVVLANHVLSGLEAAWSINRHNVKVRAQAHMVPDANQSSITTVGSLQFNW